MCTKSENKGVGLMKTMGTLFVAAIVLTLLMPTMSSAAACETLSATSENSLLFSVDYLPRVSFGAPLETTSCAQNINLGAEPVQFPIYAYNLGEGIKLAEFRVTAYGVITQFESGSDFFNQMPLVNLDGPYTTADISVGSHVAVCGPVLLGIIYVAGHDGAAGIDVELSGFGGTETPMVTIGSGLVLPTRDPFHGAYAGQVDWYHCQPSLCREPLGAIDDLIVVEDGGAFIRLNWTAREGNFTMIRYRNDGGYPQSIFDGQLLILIPSFNGTTTEAIFSDIEQDFYQFRFTAFNLELAGEDVVNGSQLECGSFAYGELDPSIPNEMTTWGAVKQQYR